MTTRTRRPARTLVAFILVFLITGGFASAFNAQAAFAATYVPISGTGSTWSQNALDQWRRNVQANYGMTVNYSGNGSSGGRQDFIAGTVDFAISEIPFQTSPEDGSQPEKPTTPFAYMPIVAGGTSFMYNLKIGGKRVTTLRLAGETVTKIFTGVITNWNDPQILRDNPELAMPDKPIVPVVRSDGSGSTAQFTLWMSKQHSAIWDTFCTSVKRPTPCGLTSLYPTPPNGKAQALSLGVAGYVSQDYGEGAITYVEYSYALKSGFPVAQVLNTAGNYVLPTGAAVAVALQNAVINTTVSSPDYLTQNLDGVYNSADPVAYPLSSYSYMIVPTATTANFTAEKGASLSTFANYMLCEGQKQAEVLGYSPLPGNLVNAGLDQVKRIPGAAEAASVCAPGSIVPPPTAESGAKAAEEAAAAAAAAAAAGAGGSSDTAVYDANGALLSGSASGGALSSPFTLADSGFGGSQFVMLFAGILVVAAVALPPVFSRRLKRAGKTPVQ